MQVHHLRVNTGAMLRAEPFRFVWSFIAEVTKTTEPCALQHKFK